MDTPSSRKVPAGAEYDTIRTLVKCLNELGMKTSRHTPDAAFTAFSIPLLDAMTPIFSRPADINVIERLKRVFPEWSTDQPRITASFWFKAQTSRKYLYNESSLSEQLPEDDAKACDICHKIHPAGENKRNTTKPRSKSTASTSASTKSSASKVSKASPKKLPAKNRAVRDENGKKRVVPDFLDDSDEDFEGSEEVEETTFICQPCPLTGCKKRQKCSVVKYLRHGCLRKDLHEDDIFGLVDNDWEAQIKKLSSNVENWSFTARGASASFANAGSGDGTADFATWFKQMCKNEDDMAKLKFVASDKIKSKDYYVKRALCRFDFRLPIPFHLVGLLSANPRHLCRAEFDEDASGKTTYLPFLKKWIKDGALQEGDFLLMTQGSFPTPLKGSKEIQSMCSAAGVKIRLIPDRLATMNLCVPLIETIKAFIKSPDSLTMGPDGALSFLPLPQMMQAATAGVTEVAVKQAFRESAGIQ